MKKRSDDDDGDDGSDESEPPGPRPSEDDAPARNLGFAPTAIVAVVDTNVWRVRRLSELLQENGIRVLLLGSSGNALQLLSSARSDVVIVGDGLDQPSAPELCDALRAKLEGDRPFFVRLTTGEVSPTLRAKFDALVTEPVADATLIATLVTTIRARRAAA